MAVDRYTISFLATGVRVGFLYFAGLLQFWHMVAFELLWSSMRSMNPTAGQSTLRDLVPQADLMGALVSGFGAALGLALTSVVSMILTGLTFYRLLRAPGRPSD